MQSIDPKEAYAYGTIKDLLSKKEDINIIIKYYQND